MKKITLVAIFMALGLGVFGQESELSEYFKKLDQVNLDLVYPLVRNRQAEMMEYPKTFKITADELFGLSAQDPLVLFPDLQYQYNTDLKMKRFLGSEDYKILKDKMDIIATTIKEKGVMFSLPREFLSNYDLTNKRFTLLVGQSFPRQDSYMGPPTTSYSTNDIFWGYFKVPTKVKTFPVALAPAAKELVQYFIPIPCEDEDKAVKIEEGISNQNLTIYATIKPELVIQSMNFGYFEDKASLSGLINKNSTSRNLKKVSTTYGF